MISLWALPIVVIMVSLSVAESSRLSGRPKRHDVQRIPSIQEREVLILAAAALSRDPEAQLPSWRSSNPNGHCSWGGVHCNDEGRVDMLDVYGKGLAGRIPSSLTSLTSLGTLNAKNNHLTGGIPSEIGVMSGLHSLDLGNNSLSGTIPASLSNCHQLELLALDNNQLSGTIPPELGAMGGLYDIYLNANQLSGSIPAELSSLHFMLNIYLNDNRLTGTIPSELSQVHIEEFDVARNHLTGNITAQLEAMGWMGHDALEVLEWHPQFV